MRVIKLTENCTSAEATQIADFSNWILDIGNGVTSSKYFAKRAILAPFHDIVSQINNYMLDKFPGEEMCYYSYDSIQSDCVNPSSAEDEFPLEFLNSLQIGNFPEHQLKLKVGVPVILLRNLDQTIGLCNGTRMVIRTLGTWFIEVEILTGTHVGERVYLPRLSLTSKQISFSFNDIVTFKINYTNIIITFSFLYYEIIKILIIYIRDMGSTSA
ncbi:hypothetical protein LINPERPRIM_LOCUS12884 [Linum perenne]